MLTSADLAPTMPSTTFLNEIADRYPEAISFAPGRPAEEFFEPAAVSRYFELFTDHSANRDRLSTQDLVRRMCRCGRTKGIIHDLIARHLPARRPDRLCRRRPGSRTAGRRPHPVRRRARQGQEHGYGEHLATRGGATRLRLSCGTLEPPAVVDGVGRLAAFVEHRAAQQAKGHPIAT